MPARTLDHYTIRCRDLERTRDFYSQVLGLSVGARPNLGFAGYWLYCGDAPVVHLVANEGAIGAPDDHETTGRLDHIAFRSEDIDSVTKELEARHIAFRGNTIPDIGVRQLFLRDPDGILVELNFFD